MKTAGIASTILGLLATSALAASAFAAPRPLSDAQMNQVVAGDNFAVDVTIELTNSTPAAGNGGAPDPSLLNPWGISQAPNDGTPIWVSDNNAGVTTLYNVTPDASGNRSFAKVPLTVNLLDGSADQGALPSPSGTVFNGAGGFQVTESNNGTPVVESALFLFDTEDGTIQGWSPIFANGHLSFPTVTALAVDDSTSGAAFKGLTLANGGAMGTTPELFAADFANNQVDIFNNTFTQVGTIVDPHVPAGWGPFNAQALNGLIYITYAPINQTPGPSLGEGQPGPGNGIVDVFNPVTGQLTRLISQNAHLNAPWGLDIAPANFGQFAGDLLVGNFGDGRINAFNPTTGAFVGTLVAPNMGGVFKETDLWALFPQPDGAIIFSAGGANQASGTLGVIKPQSAPASWAFQSHVVLGH